MLAFMTFLYLSQHPNPPVVKKDKCKARRKNAPSWCPPPGHLRVSRHPRLPGASWSRGPVRYVKLAVELSRPGPPSSLPPNFLCLVEVQIPTIWQWLPFKTNSKQPKLPSYDLLNTPHHLPHPAVEIRAGTTPHLPYRAQTYLPYNLPSPSLPYRAIPNTLTQHRFLRLQSAPTIHLHTSIQIVLSNIALPPNSYHRFLRLQDNRTYNNSPHLHTSCPASNFLQQVSEIENRNYNTSLYLQDLQHLPKPPHNPLPHRCPPHKDQASLQHPCLPQSTTCNYTCRSTSLPLHTPTHRFQQYLFQ